MDFQSKLKKLINKNDIQELISRYALCLDEKNFERSQLSKIFTENASVKLPSMPQAEGLDAICLLHSNLLAQFESTHHMTSDCLVNFWDENTADIRCNLFVMHRYNDIVRVENGDDFLIVRDVLIGTVKAIEGSWLFSNLRLKVIFRD